jgi:ribosomal protein S18 acetylase RimI-like enzyme
MLRAAVHVGHRGAPRPGLARALIAGAEAEAKRRGCALVMFHVYDLLARGFYDRLGYQRVGSSRDVLPAALPAGTARTREPACPYDNDGIR